MGLHHRIYKRLIDAVSPGAREARMANFIDKMKPAPGTRIVDLGGTTKLWKFVDIPLDITVMNLATQEIDEFRYGNHQFRIIRGDATNAPELADMSFDMVFSNSVIEHVGPYDKQQAFADTVRRLAPSWWVQTPAKSFPVEAHTGLPFWWYYPRPIREALVKRWKKGVPDYGDFVDGTRVLPLDDIKRFFPGATIDTEKLAGFTKSYTAWHRA